MNARGRQRTDIHRAAMILAVGAAGAVLWTLREPRAPGLDGSIGARAAVADSADLKTWWHDDAELNDSTPVPDERVRRSTVYDVSVAAYANPHVLFDSFVYMSVPRSGSEKRDYTHDDGAEYADEAGLTMSWTSFLYGADTWVHVTIKEGSQIASADDVTIRPTTLQFRKEQVDNRTVRILVPYAADGHRFSVEFESQLLTSYLDSSGRLTTDGSPGRPAVHTEPSHAMLVFAEPVLTGEDVDRLVPDPASHAIHYPAAGQVSNLADVTEEVIYFRPGTYHMAWNEHAHFRADVRWIYLAPGAYVKGAFQFRAGPEQLKVTGFGVLSGEKYVYEPDRANEYRHRAAHVPNCHGTCVKMLEFEAGAIPQHLTLHGVTVVEPPYHSFVAYGDERRFRMDVARFKQVGGWYWQTDGLELYQGSALQSSFFHANDDALKLYAGDLVANDIVVWQGDNGAVIQWGWAPRNIEDVRVNGVDVIHNRMHRPAHNACIVNSARDQRASDSDRTAKPDTWVRDLTLENLRSEGMNLCAMRLYALSSWENLHIRDLWIEQWNDLDAWMQASRFQVLSDEDGVPVTIGDEVHEGKGLAIENYVVGGERIEKAGDNWRADRLGRLDFDATLWNNWNAW